ncbi:TrbC/VirB2 family protein [Candidatus Uhrbacteria bacterium]|nr:TrbC/VirB2 family protein [Candidatus Uhrbacteria bacterium]
MKKTHSFKTQCGVVPTRTRRTIFSTVILSALFFFQFGIVLFTPGVVYAEACQGLPLFAPTTGAQCSTQCAAQGRNFHQWNDAGYDGGAKCCCKNRAAAAAIPSAPCTPGGTSLCNPLGTQFSSTSQIPALVGNVLKGLFGIIGTIALVIFIYGGFMWMTAFGEESKIKKGWDTMIWAGLGLAVIFGSYVAVDFILKAILER